jgi:NAD+ diphosphatase
MPGKVQNMVILPFIVQHCIFYVKHINLLCLVQLYCLFTFTMNDDYYFSLKTRFIPGHRVDESLSSTAFWFIFQGEKLLVSVADSGREDICSHSPKQLHLTPIFTQFLGRYGSINCFVAEVPEALAPPPLMQFKGLRSLFGRVDSDLFILAGRAIQVLHWHREHRFCGKCGTPMENRKTELARICPACGFVSFPRLSPAVIMSVIKKNHILLARSPRFPPGMYSTLAGFVEPGETLEEAVKREVREEVDIRLGNIRYIASQPWPFPHSIMIGFTAEYAGGEIAVDGDEIEDAGWFSVENLPTLPSKVSIARLLIDRFVGGVR